MKALSAERDGALTAALAPGKLEPSRASASPGY